MSTSKEYVLQVSTKGFVSQFSFVNPYQHQNILEAIQHAATGLIDALSITIPMMIRSPTGYKKNFI